MIDLIVEADSWQAVSDLEQLVQNASAAALGEDRSASVLLTDNSALQSLNKQFRGIDKPTNVLSFEDDSEPSYVGDIAIAFETVLREASEQSKSIENHLSHLVIHGCLHLLGYDHETDAEAEEMEDKEVALLAVLGIDDPYKDTEITGAADT